MKPRNLRPPLPFLSGVGTSIVSALAALILATPSPAQETNPDVREFRSKSGSRLKAMIVGMDPSGKVLLQPYAPKAIPLASLSEEDQEYVRAWQKKHALTQEWVRQGERAEQYKDPGITLLKDTLRTLEGETWKPYEPRNVKNLQYVAYYFTKEHPDDEFIHDLSDSYEKMRNRSEVVEVVYITLGTSDQAVKNYVKEKEFAFPVLESASIGLVNSSIVGQLFKGAYPQLVVVDRKGNVQANSFRGKNETPQLIDTLEQLEKMVRRAPSPTP